MSLEAQLELIYNTAQSGTREGKVCRDILLSLWDDGISHGCDLRELMSLDHDHYTAVQQVIESFYNSKQQLDQYMTTRQMTVLDEIDYGKKKRPANDPALSVADTFGKVKMR